MNKNSFFKYIFFIAATVFVVSCDNEANEIGANIVGIDNFELGTPEFYDVLAYTQPLGPVETTNIRSDQGGVNQLGILQDNVFGKTSAHVVTEVRLSEEDPIDFSLEPQITEAILSIPYFSHKTGATASDGATLYAIDSLYGDENGKLDLGIYESTFYIRGNADNPNGVEKYYSNQLAAFTKGSKLNTAPDISQNTAFEFDSKEKNDTVIVASEKVGVKIGPTMQITLDKTLMGQKLFGPDAVGKLINNNVFTNYFRGLHFTVAQSGSAAVKMALMNFPGGKITVKYKQFVKKRDPDPDKPLPAKEDKILTLTLNGKNVNLFEYERTPDYGNVLAAAPDYTSGSSNLYLKGGAGSMAVLELFKDDPDLSKLRSTKGIWLINDASITFYIDRDKMAGAREPNRIYLYDLDNKKPLLDYSTDVSVASSIKYFKNLHGGIIEKSSDKRGTKYKIRITNYIRNLIKDSEAKNVRLGLVVTENINDTSNKDLKTPINLPGSTTFAIDGVPAMSVANPFGTILYGSNIPEGDLNYDKRPKLTIYYTKPN